LKSDFDFKQFVSEAKVQFQIEQGKEPKIIYSPKRAPFADEMQDFIKTKWKEAKQKWPRMYNDKLYHVTKKEYSELNIVFHTIDSDYQEYVGTRNSEFKKLFGTDFVVNPLSIGLLVATSDYKILIGRRKFVDTWEGFYSTVAGYVQHPKRPETPPDLNETINQELFQEAAIVSKDIVNVNFLGSFGDSYLIYEVKVKVAYSELVSRKPSEVEFARLEYIENADDALELFVDANRLAIMPGCLRGLIYFGLQHFGTKWGSDLADTKGSSV